MPRFSLICVVLLLLTTNVRAQNLLDLPQYSNQLDPFQEEYILLEDDGVNSIATITRPPESPVRPMAEWEEVDAITISWDTIGHARPFYKPLADIVRYAQKECKVYINCPAEKEQIQFFLDLYDVPYSENVIFLEHQEFNSVWIRDYGPNSAYINNVDSLILVDWVYNRPSRPDDDNLPEGLAEIIEAPLFETVDGEYRLTATGGNFMADGIETGFSSRLVLDENLDKTEEEVDQIMADFLGVKNYIKFNKLAYDGINHIDMHMKLLDEERIIFGEYPEGKGDHDVIEANIEYLLANKTNAFGEPYEIIRVEMPPNFDDSYPGEPGLGFFKTYTNALFINKTILVPVYEEKHDTTALRIWQEAMPGYNIQGIDCNNIIRAFGAVHCITKEIGVKDPLRIVFQKIKDQNVSDTQGYPLTAVIQHRDGIERAILHYREAGTETYQAVEMQVKDLEQDTYEASIPDFLGSGKIEYYVEATAVTGKTMMRPLPAPEAYYSFEVGVRTSVNTLPEDVFSRAAFPNPSSELVCIPIELSSSLHGDLSLVDIHGRIVEVIHSGSFPAGSSKYFTNVSSRPAGIYTLRLSSDMGVLTQKIVVGR